MTTHLTPTLLCIGPCDLFGSFRSIFVYNKRVIKTFPVYLTELIICTTGNLCIIFTSIYDDNRFHNNLDCTIYRLSEKVKNDLQHPFLYNIHFIVEELCVSSCMVYTLII